MIFKNITYTILSATCAVLLSLGVTTSAAAQEEDRQAGESEKVELKAAHSSADRQLVGKRKKYDVYDLNDEIERCADTMSRIPRLICYDELAKNLGYVPPEEADREEVILATYGFWEATKKRNAAGEDIFYLKNDSVEDIISVSGLKRKATLVAKCKSGVTDFYLDWKAEIVNPGRVGNQMVITYQLDGQRRKAVEWELSLDRNALFAPNPIEYLRNLQHYKRLVLTVTPEGDTTQVVVHEIKGLKDALGLIVRECYNQ